MKISIFCLLLLLSQISTAQTVQIVDAGQSYNLEVTLRSSFFSGAANDLNAKALESYTKNCSTWQSDAQTFQLAGRPLVASAQCGEGQLLTGKNVFQYVGRGQLIFRLPEARQTIVIITEDISAKEQSWRDVITAPATVSNLCDIWRNDLNQTGHGKIIYSHCEIPEIKVACCASLKVSAVATAVLAASTKASVTKATLTTEVLDTDNPQADRKAAVTDLDQQITQWKSGQIQAHGSSVIYAHCGPQEPVSYGSIQMNSKCTLVTE